jgi:gliding motility-associated-like protein
MKKITLLLLFLLLSVSSYSQLATESFENTPGITGPLPAFWTLGAPGDWAVFERNTPADVGTGQSWGINAFAAGLAHSGTQCASVSREQINQGSTSEDYLATPSVHINATGITELHFWTRTFTSGNQGTVYKVMVAPAIPGLQIDPNAYSPVAQWSELDLIVPASNFNVWTEKTVDLSAYAGFDIYVAFVREYTQPTINLDGDRWLIDDVAIDLKCVVPTNLTATGMTSTTANLNWNPNGSTTWEVIATPTTGTPIVYPAYSGGLPFTATGLSPLTTYSFQVRAICSTGFSSEWSPASANFTTTVAPPVCGGNLVDSGGPAGNYSNNENTAPLTVTPTAGNVVTVTFTAFNTQAGSDFLRIYDGPTTASPLMATLSGTALPGSYTSTAVGGELTFVFTSNATTTAAGYAANITCGPPSACRIPTAVTPSAITTNSVTLNWTQPANADTSVATMWDIIAVPCNSAAPGAGATPTANDITGPLPYLLNTGLTPASCFDIYVRAVCGATNSPWTPVPVQVITLVAPPICGGNFVDSGGTTGNYTNNSTLTTAICPVTAGDAVTVTFTAFNTQAGIDLLKVYDGNGVLLPSTLIATLSGTTLPPSFTSSSSTGCLTFAFTSDGTTTAAGWIANVICGPQPTCPAPTNLTSTLVTHNSATLNWVQPASPGGATATLWDIITLPCNSPAPTAGSTPTLNDVAATFPYLLTGLAANTCFDVYVRAQCDGATAGAWTVIPTTFTTLIAPPICGGNFVDAGGIAGAYAANSNVTTIICPTVPGEVVTVTFTAFNTETNFDALYVYNGNAVVPANLIPSANPAANVPGGLAGGYWGTAIPCPFTSASANGCLTFVFRSDPSVQNPGWVANVTCGPPPTCATPSAGSAGTVTFNSAILNWTQPPNADTTVANTWDIIALPCNAPAPAAGSTPTVNDYTGALPYTLSSLTPATCYNVYVRAVCGATNSPWICTPIVFTTLAAPPICGGNFVDAGGVAAPYAASSNITTTICPVTPGDVVTVTFTSFNTEVNFDALYVYNGNAVVPANLIPSSNPAANVPGGLAGGYWGTTLPCPFTSATADGCLTFVFRSDPSVQNPGWVANVTCAPPPACRVPASLVATGVTHNSAILNWTQAPNADNSTATMWDIIALPCNSPAPGPGATPTVNDYTGTIPYTLTGLTPATCYDVYIRAVCSPTVNSAWVCTPTTITTLVAPPECGGNFVDAGGLGNYANNANITTIICPNSPGEIVTVTFTSFNTEANWDGLYVYNGSGVIPSNQIPSNNGAGNVPGGITGSWWGNLTGANLPGPFTSTAADGCLTFVFRSDASGVNPGWVSNITCTPAPTCARPVITGATLVGQTTATISWTQPLNPNGSVATAWEYLVLPANTPIPTGGGIPISNSPIVINGLSAGTAYFIIIRAICSPTDASTWAILNFATLPTNDECANATFAIVNQNLNCVQTTHGTLAGATASTPATTCSGAGAANDDVWFSFTATTITHVISFNNVTPATALSYAIYQGTCNGLTEVGCNTGAGLQAGTTYFIRVFSTGTAPVFTNFDLCIGTLPCTEAPAFCTGQTVTYANSTNVPSLGQIGCLFTSPNPAFFFLQVNQQGPLSYLISQVDTTGTPRDVDYVAWGPFTDLNTACTGVPANPLGQTVPIPTPVTGCPGTLHACSYSIAPQEIMCIPNAQLCDVYVIMITNFSNAAGTVTFTQTNTGGGTTECFPINTFNYPQTYYCQNQPNPTPVLAPGASAGTYTSTPGLVIDSATGTINLLASTPGAYVITSTTQTSTGGVCTNIPTITTTRTVIITAPADATIAYSAATYCNSITTPQGVTHTGTVGGTYSASPSGLLINAITGEIIPVASTPGVYTITYTIAALGGCPIFTATTQVEILASPVLTQTSVAACDTFTLPALTVGDYYTLPGGATGGGTLITDLVITDTQPVSIYAEGANGCVTERTFTVTINTVPTPTFTVTQSSCTLPTGTITVTAPVSAGNAAPPNIFISEVTDADTGSLSYVELYNATGAAVNLNAYKLKFYTWGAPPTAENLQCDLTLAGIMPNNATNVIKVSNNANITGITPNQTFTLCPGVNNNDNIRLTTVGNVLVDQWGPTDGSIFTPAGQTGYTYRRLDTATLPSTTWSAADWSTLDPEDYTNIGTYSYTVSTFEYSIDNGVTFQTNPLFTNVAPGPYILVVRDITTGCLSAPVDVIIDAVNAIPSETTFTYVTPVCQNSTTNPLPDTSIAGFTAGGTFTSVPSTGIALNASTGEITLSGTTANSYDITYTIPFDPVTCQSFSSTTFTVVITNVITPVVVFSYTTPICQNAQATLSPTLGTGFTTGGTFTSTAGLTIDSTTGVIDLTTTTAGPYTITYSLAGTSCLTATTGTFDIVISPVITPVTTFTYTTPVCLNSGTNPMPNTSATGFTSGGAYTSNPSTGIDINPATGEINLAGTTAGTYVITYAVAANAATCQVTNSTDFTIVINATVTPGVGFSYTTPICKNAAATLSPTLAAGFTSGGTFSSTAGLVINASTGVIDLANSTAGPYTVTYAVTANAGICQIANSGTFAIVINPVITPGTNFSYDSPFCSSVAGSLELPTLGTGFTAGGTFSATGGLTIDAVTGEIDLDTPGSYTVTYAVTADPTTCRVAANGTAQVVIIAPILVELSGGCQSVYVLNVAPQAGGSFPTGTTFSWQNAANVEVGTSQSLDVPAAGFYTVIVTVDGCSTESTPFEVTSIACQIQKGISVNNDGFNDTFDLTGFDVKKLSIFNRYGQEVYSRANYVNQWGGKSDGGDELPDGTYFYVIDKNAGGSVTGWIYINRAQ